MQHATYLFVGLCFACLIHMPIGRIFVGEQVNECPAEVVKLDKAPEQDC